MSKIIMKYLFEIVTLFQPFATIILGTKNSSESIGRETLEDIAMIARNNLPYILIIIGTLLTGCSFTGTIQTSGNAEVEKEEEPSTLEEDEVIRLNEQTITYSVEGLKHEETGLLNTSTNQPFSIYVFKGFQLEEEESGKDVLFHKDSQDVFMRIELFPEDVNFFDLEYNSYKQLKVVSDTVHRDVWSQPDSLLKGAVMLQAVNENEWVQVLLIKDSVDFPNMKLTIHAHADDDVVGKLLAMARTIAKTEVNR
jgi:hypothetical protein